jgi:hypothetical protein
VIARPRCPVCGQEYCDWSHVASMPRRPIAALVVAFVVMALSGLLLVAQGSPGWQDRPAAFTSPTATLAAQTVTVPVPEVGR